MIYFKPTVVNSSSCTAVFEALEGEDKLGECRLLLNGSYADVYSLSFSKKTPEIGEGLLRSAYNYAANHSAYIGTLSAKEPENASKLLNFEFSNGVYFNDIPTLLSGTCQKKCGI